MNSRISLAAVVLVVSFGCGGSSYSSPSSPSPAPASPTTSGTPVSIVGGAATKSTTAYAPSPISVAVGGSVTWINNDTVTHTSTGDNSSWNSGGIAPGEQFTKTFSAAGSFPYHCTIHPGMVGTVTVQ